jgi:hypothetical protein
VKRIVTTLVIVGALLVGACGSDGAAPATTRADESSTTEAPATSAAPATSEPAETPLDAASELGASISVIYLAAYDDVIVLLSDRPDPADALVELAELKEQYVQELVALGHEREALDSSLRAQVDSVILSTVSGLDSGTLAEYQAALDHYVADREVYDLILSFNIIGQYANFDLLREQEPEEAARLGVE